MKIREKGWIWTLSGPFAARNFTTIWDTIWHPKGIMPSERIVRHEAVHAAQQQRWGLLVPVWFWLYLVGFPAGLPFLWNPWRWRWEFEAHREEGLSDSDICQILRRAPYGWLVLHRMPEKHTYSKGGGVS